MSRFGHRYGWGRRRDVDPVDVLPEPDPVDLFDESYEEEF